MKEKEEWIKAYTTGKFENCDKDVINFIANIIFKPSCDRESIINLFENGYCYYFAVILKTAFNRGEICWHRNFGHIVWKDDDDTPYDINGPFYDYKEGDLLPVEKLGGLLIDFMHNGKEYKCGSTILKDWIDSHYFKNDAEAISLIYQRIPKEELDDQISVEDNVIMYWFKHEDELSKLFTRKEDLK